MQTAQQFNRSVSAAAAPLAERMAFLKKVYGLLSISVFLAAIASWYTVSNLNFLTVVRDHLILFFVLEIATVFFALWARKKETLGLVALFTFTILTGVSIISTLTG